MKIALSGKGGTGKTTIAASLALTFARHGYQVYAIDADPDANLAQLLGVNEPLSPLVELEEVIEERVGGEGGLFALNPEVDDVLDDYSLEVEGVRLLRMGAVKQANSSCYCRENSFLKAVVDSLLFSREEVVIMDMGAGIEHLTRGTSRGVDLMLVVCEPSRISLQTAKTVSNLALEAGVPRVFYLGNRIRSEREREFLEKELGEELLVSFAYDSLLLEKGLNDSAEIYVLEETEELFHHITEGGR